MDFKFCIIVYYMVKENGDNFVVKLLIEYNLNYSATIRKLRYPSYRALVNWCREYNDTDALTKNLKEKFIQKNR